MLKLGDYAAEVTCADCGALCDCGIGVERKRGRVRYSYQVHLFRLPNGWRVTPDAIIVCPTCAANHPEKSFLTF